MERRLNENIIHYVTESDMGPDPEHTSMTFTIEGGGDGGNPKAVGGTDKLLEFDSDKRRAGPKI